MEKRLAGIQSRCKTKCEPFNSIYRKKGIKCLLTVDELMLMWKRDGANKMECATVDRINNNGNYELSNCRFLERSENSSRATRSYLVTFCGFCGKVKDNHISYCERECLYNVIRIASAKLHKKKERLKELLSLKRQLYKANSHHRKMAIREMETLRLK